VSNCKEDSNSKIEKINYHVIDSEKKLEDVLSKDISILGDDYLLVGRQVRTDYGKLIDLLCIDYNGKITIIELKKSKTPREVVAQSLDYASWVQGLSYDDIKTIFNNNNLEFEKVFEEKFGTPPPEKINQEHDILIVASEMDNETERIINYLSDNYSVPINVVFFKFFKDGTSEYISRSWLIDPSEVEEKSSKLGSQNKGETWNGKDFVVNIDTHDDLSTWEDSQKYGFVSAGGGKWYVKTLEQLFPGARVFAMIPKKGYLGVGTVLEPAVPIKDYIVEDKAGNKTPILNVDLKADFIKNNSGDAENCYYLVRIQWQKMLPENQAYWEKGLSANQNSAFKLKNSFTMERLVKRFGLEE
jgi:hypothetical protein